MPIQFQVATGTDADKRRWTKPGGERAAIDTSITRLRKHRGDGFRLRVMGEHDEFGEIRELDELGTRERARLRGMNVGDVLVALAVDDGFRVLIRKVHTAAASIDTAGNDRIDRIHTALWSAFRGDGLVSWGINVCRHIDWDPTMPWSQHAYANAEDVHASVGVMDRVAHWLIAQKHEGRLPLGDEILWQGHNLVTGNTVGDHFDHVHYAGNPMGTGTPPCAR